MISMTVLKHAPYRVTTQVGFFKVIVRPLFKAWVEVFPCCYPMLEQVTPTKHQHHRCVPFKTCKVQNFDKRLYVYGIAK
jgi:hypothetical protein